MCQDALAHWLCWKSGHHSNFHNIYFKCFTPVRLLNSPYDFQMFARWIPSLTFDLKHKVF